MYIKNDDTDSAIPLYDKFCGRIKTEMFVW
jgi:hypothetical protein